MSEKKDICPTCGNNDILGCVGDYRECQICYSEWRENDKGEIVEIETLRTKYDNLVEYIEIYTILDVAKKIENHRNKNKWRKYPDEKPEEGKYFIVYHNFSSLAHFYPKKMIWVGELGPIEWKKFYYRPIGPLPEEEI